MWILRLWPPRLRWWRQVVWSARVPIYQRYYMRPGDYRHCSHSEGLHESAKPVNEVTTTSSLILRNLVFRFALFYKKLSLSSFSYWIDEIFLGQTKHVWFQNEQIRSATSYWERAALFIGATDWWTKIHTHLLRRYYAQRFQIQTSRLLQRSFENTLNLHALFCRSGIVRIIRSSIEYTDDREERNWRSRLMDWDERVKLQRESTETLELW